MSNDTFPKKDSISNFGISKSADGRLTIDWDNAKITITDKARKRVLIGFFPVEGLYGIRIYDATGAEVLNKTA